MASPFPNPRDNAVPTAALWFLTLLLQPPETQVACALAAELKTGSTDEPDASFMDLPWVKPILFTYQCTCNLSLTPLLPFLLSVVLN